MSRSSTTSPANTTSSNPDSSRPNTPYNVEDTDRLTGVVGDVANLVPPIVDVLDNGNYIIRGKKVTDYEALGQMSIPEHETCVEVSRSVVAALVRS